jgi:hypothetical protein
MWQLSHSRAVGHPDMPIDSLKAITEVFMPIHLKHHDKNSTAMKHLEISLLISEEAILSQVSYTTFKTMFGVLC